MPRKSCPVQSLVVLLATVSTLNAHITELIPSQVTAGGQSFVLRATGGTFDVGEYLLWNGVPLPTNWIDENELTAPITAEMIRTAGTATVTLAGYNSLPLTINPPLSITTLSPLARGAIGTAYSQRL